jgi:PKD repeat protein
LGQQQIELTTFTADGCSSTVGNFIDITETLSASFTPASNIVAAGDPIAFSNTSQGNGIYLWNFGDNTFSSQVDPSHAFGDNYIDSTLTISLITKVFKCLNLLWI